MQAATEQAQFSLRNVRAEDFGVIFTAWLKQVQHSTSFARNVPAPLFIREQQRVIEGILGRKSAKVLIACMPEDDHVVLGWACSETRAGPVDVVHFIYVKPPFRGYGIGKALLTASVADPKRFHYTQDTDTTMALRRRSKLHGVYCPHWAFYEEITQ